MIHDNNLRFATNQAMTGAGAFASLSGVSEFYPFPSPVTGVLAQDLLVARDQGQGYPLIARLEAETTFASTDATMTIALAVAVSNANDGTGAFVIARATPTLVGAWPAGAWQELVIPKLPATLSSAAYRYCLLGFVITTAIGFGGALFTGGVFSAYIMANTDGDILKKHASGWRS